MFRLTKLKAGDVSMQIDFHHGVIYVLSRFAGFSPQESNVIAYSSQYVDDAINSGLIKFDNGSMYYHIRSAHGTYDPENTNDEANLHSWLPFHFLPGNEVNDMDKSYGEIARLICRPNSEIAQDMLAKCIMNNIYIPHLKWGPRQSGSVA